MSRKTVERPPSRRRRKRSGKAMSNHHLLSSCVDTPSWSSVFAHSNDCAAYERLGWCASGAVVNQSAAGSLFSAPEQNCCVCGKAAPPPSHATQLVFLASHLADDAIASKLSHMSRDLSRLSGHHHRPWLLLFDNDQAAQRDSATVQRWRALDAHVFPWNHAQVFRLFPKLEENYRASRAVFFSTSEYLRNYFIFHTSLVLWHRFFGEGYPRLRHVWRVEPDVSLVGHGGWSTLLARAAHLSTDVMLPRLTLEGDSDARYRTHWQLNSAYTRHVPPSERAWSLVCVGRYSLAFLHNVMTPQWAEGVLAYEEIFLPTSCLAHRAENCTAGDFGTLVDARAVRFRPAWECERVQERGGNLAFWHPIKEAGCAAGHEAQHATLPQGDALYTPLPPPSPPVSPPVMPEEAAKEFVFRGGVREEPLVSRIVKPTSQRSYRDAWKARLASSERSARSKATG